MGVLFLTKQTAESAIADVQPKPMTVSFDVFSMFLRFYVSAAYFTWSPGTRTTRLALLGSGGATLQNVLRHPFMKAESHPHFFAQTPISGGSQKVNLLHFAYLEAAQIQPGSSKSTSQGGLTSQ